MSYDATESPLDERIQAMLEILDEGDLRYQTLKGTVDFQSAWIELAEHLFNVDRTEAFREWGFRSFAVYCTNELRLSRTVAGKLMEGYQWVENQAPQYLPANRPPEDEASRSARLTHSAPDMDTVAVLAKAHREVKEERLPAATYADLKDAALRGERTVSALRKEFREAVPEHLRPEPVQKPLHHLRRALSEVEKALAQIASDDDLLTEASALRDTIFALVASRHGEE
ncbi:MAG: hypothetical protein H0U74_04020 [Bradymonadaceae bacterium]|nr:hypothetical protein [Lujinxingiaceae bacterium]